jgi:hypothetical protein
MASDLETRFHETWLGMVQPVEGLVVSIPVLVEAQTMHRHGPALQETLQALCPPVDGRRRYRDLAELLAQLLGWTPDLYDRGEALPANLSRYIAEGHQTIRPTLALRKVGGDEATPAAGVAAVSSETEDVAADGADDEDDGDATESDDEGDDESDGATARPTGRSLTAIPDIETPESLAGKPYVALVWELPAGLSLDKPETVTGDWRYPPASKFDRLLRACRVPIGVLTNGEVMRLVYAPHGEASGSITFDLTDMGDVGGRPILDALVMLLSSQRLFGVRAEDALPALLRRSRERQANVTNALAAQVFDALDTLLRGFEAAARRDRGADLDALLRRDDPDDPQEDLLYGGLLTVLLRLVFILYAEDRELLPTSNPTYARSLGVGQLFEDLQRDHGAFPDTMSRRFGAWSRLLALFRTLHDGVEHGALSIPRRRGELFAPQRFPFLELWSAAVADPSDAQVPTVDDETVYRVLERLMILEGQRLSYKVLTVEQIGSVYEALMGYGVTKLAAPAVCCGHKSLQKKSTGGVWIEAAPVLDQAPGSRAKFLVAAYNVEKGASNRIAGDLKAAKTEAAVLDALDRIALRKVARRGAGSLVLQPGEERRRTSSHYTPRSLSEPIVRRTLEPLIMAMNDKGEPSSRQLLSLKVCDPAMGSGAFLVAACRFLGDHVVAAWEREGQTDKIASAKEDVVNHARRLVAQTCLYGVDRNPFAVSLAKLSLWLETLARDEPFTFVDHALKHGDSLVGLSFEQLQAFHWAPSPQMELIERELSSAIAESLALRQQILDLAGDSSPGATRLKEQLLWDANDAQERLRIIGDLVIGAFFEKSKKEREAERRSRLDAVRAWLADGGDLPAELTETRQRIRRRLPIFHWPLEFPEVFHGARQDPLEANAMNNFALMDAFVGNPPFGGKNRINQDSGNDYIPWLQEIHPQSHGNADICSHFLRRCCALLGAHGTMGLIATNSVSQGDSRTTGLQRLLHEHTIRIYDAVRSMRWPSAGAAVSVAIVHLARGRAASGIAPSLDGEPVEVINSRLRPRPERPDPVPLSGNSNLRSQGVIAQGDFTLTLEEAAALLRKHKNSEVIFPYLGGDELNSTPDQSFRRHIINFGTRSLVEAEGWPELLARVRDKVKPTRDRLGANAVAQQAKKIWWRFWAPRPELSSRLAQLDRCLVCSRVSKHLAFVWQPTGRVFSETCYVFTVDSDAIFGVMQSRVHDAWARLLSSSLEDRLRYSASDCFDTFAFPRAAEDEGKRLATAALALYDARALWMIQQGRGLTDTYNTLKDPQINDDVIQRLRDLHVQMDRAVLAAYGWDDIAVPPYTDPVTDADWKAKEVFEDEVIDRLFALNAERAKEEQVLGASATNRKSKAGKKTATPRKPNSGASEQLTLTETARRKKAR